MARIKSARCCRWPRAASARALRARVTVTDYQRALAPAGEETYEIGALEKARRNVHDTWLCMTSMFKDC